MADEEIREEPEPELTPELTPDGGTVDPGAETVDQPGGSEPGSTDDDPAEKKTSRRSAPLRCQEFGEYRIVEEVARGAMGIVYRAEQRRLGREVALKVMLTGEHASDGEVRRFTREAQALARLRHPNIVPIHDIGEVDGRHYFTMDFVEGQTLSQVLLERRLTVTESLHIIQQAADAVAAAHTRGVVHRDIKPSNVMLDSDGGVHIMDFGLAKSAGAETKHTRDGTTIGTPAYMPPEQARGELSRVDERSDIYSMGAVLYEMLSGRPPFGGTNLLEIVLAVINEDPPRPRTVNSRLPRELETIIVKCMEKDPARRYHTAAELRDEIRRYQAGEPIHAQPPSFWYLLRKRVRKHAAALGMAAAILVIAAAATGAVYWVRLSVGKVEVTQAEWKEVDTCRFGRETLSTHWRLAETFHDVYLSPVLAEEKDAWIQKRTLVSKKLVFGNARAILKFRLSDQLGAEPLALGFYGDRVRNTGVERATCMFRLTAGRLQVFAHIDPENSGTPRVVADRQLPVLRPGRTYRLTAERHGIDLRMKLEEERAADEFAVLAEVGYAHPHLSNWRYKNLNVVLRADEGVVQLQPLVIQKLFLPAQTSALLAADNVFFTGNYNGAFDEYTEIAGPARGVGKPPTPYERAAANFRLGLYYEIKGRFQDAIRHYEKVRGQDGSGAMLFDSEREEKAFAALRGEALLRELSVCCQERLPGKAFELLSELERLPPEQLGGPWVWELSRGLPVLAKLRPEHAVRLAAHLKAPPGSAILGLRLADVAESVVAGGSRSALGGLLQEWLPRLKPVPQPLPRWALLAARAGDMHNCTVLFGQGSRLLKDSERKQLEDAAIQACTVFRQEGNFGRVSQVIAAVGFDPDLKETYLAALDVALRRSGGQALELLHLASRSKAWSGDERIARRAVRLAEIYCRDARYTELRKIDDAYHTSRMADVYVKAVKALRRTDAPVKQVLLLLGEAHARFGGKHAGLAAVAAEVGAAYASCANDGDHQVVCDAHRAYPSRLHLPNFLRSFENLLAKPRYDHAGEVFAYSRAHMGRDSRMTGVVREMLEHPLADEDLVAFMRQLLEVGKELGDKPGQLAAWRLELARYHLLAHNEWAAGQVYRNVWGAKSRAPRKLKVEAKLRHALLKALGDNKGDRGEAGKLLADLRKNAPKDSRARSIAAVVLNKEYFSNEPKHEEFRSKGRRLGMSRSEIEMVLAANASLLVKRNPEAKREKNRLLARAYKIVTQEEKNYSWPYELIRRKQEAALRPHG